MDIFLPIFYNGLTYDDYQEATLGVYDDLDKAIKDCSPYLEEHDYDCLSCVIIYRVDLNKIDSKVAHRTLRLKRTETPLGYPDIFTVTIEAG